MPSAEVAAMAIINRRNMTISKLGAVLSLGESCPDFYTASTHTKLYACISDAIISANQTNHWQQLTRPKHQTVM